MPQRENEFNSVSHFTETSVIFHFTIAFIGIIAAILMLVFEPITQAELITAAPVFFTCPLMFGIVKLIKYVMGYIHKRNNTGEMKRCQNQMVIGFGGISICGIIPRIVFFSVDNYYVLYYCIITCCVTSVIFYYYFINEFREKWRVNYKKKHIPLISILLAIQVVILIITMKIAIVYYNQSDSLQEKFHFMVLVFVQMYTSVFFAPCVIDIGVVSAGGIKKNQNVEMELVNAQSPVAIEIPNVDVNSPRPEEENYFVSFSDAFVFFHLFVAFIGIFVGILFLVFGPFTQADLITAVSLFCTCLSMFGIAKLMKYVVVYVHTRHDTVEMEQCWNQMMIGFGGISICGIIPRIVFLFVDDFNILYYCFITCLVTSVIFYYHFIYEFKKKWQINYEEKHFSFIAFHLIIQFAVFVGTMHIAASFYGESNYSTLLKIGVGQFYISFTFMTSMFDLDVMLDGGIKKKKNVEMELVEVRHTTPGNSNAESNSARLDCKICMEEYSESVIPRMLKECGHTICEKCAEQLLNRNRLLCPFCQTVTVVKGPASQLPKNFAVIDMIAQNM